MSQDFSGDDHDSCVTKNTELKNFAVASGLTYWIFGYCEMGYKTSKVLMK